MLADNSSALFFFFIFEEIAAAVEAMCTYFLFWQAYGIYKSLDLVELHAAETKASSYFFHHTLIFRAVCSSIFVQVLIGVAFKILNYSARNKFKVAF